MLVETAVHLDLAETLVLCDLLQIQTLPSVLRVEELADDADAAIAARELAQSRLSDRGLVDAAMHPDPHVTRMMRSLADQDWRVEVRRIDVTQVLRVCLASAGSVQCVATRSRDEFDLRACAALDDDTLVYGEIAPLIGVATAAPITPLRFPSEVLEAHLVHCVTELDHAEAFYALGLSATDAKALAATLANCGGQTEISLRTGAHTKAVLAVFDTARGRVISIAATSNGGDRWTTILPGDDYAVRSAIRRLTEELPRGDS